MGNPGAIRRLRVAGAVAVLTVALLATGLAGVFVFRFLTAPVQSDVINRSSIRRAESVAIVYRAERLERFPKEVPLLDDAIATLEETQASLNDLDPLEQAYFRHFVDAAKAVAARPEDKARHDALDDLAPRMYQIFYDKTVNYSELANDYRTRSFDTSFAGVIVILLVLGLMYAFVLRPSERVVAESVRQLEERRQRFAAMFDNSSEMMAVYGIDGRIRRANNAAIQRLGFGAGVVGRSFDVHVAPHDRDEVARAFAKTLGGEACELAIDFLDNAGNEVPVLGSLSPIVVEGRVVGVVGAARDVTVERQFERELVRGRERFRSLFEASPNAIVGFAPDGTIEEVNAVMERVSGYGIDELVGRNVTMLVAPEFREQALANVAAVLDGGARSFRVPLLARDGTVIPLDAEFLPIRVEGRSEGVFVVGKDLTREEALARLDERDERMRALYRIASSPAVVDGAQIDEALVLGAKALRMEYGYVVKVSDGLAVIRHRVAPDATNPIGARFASAPSVGGALLSSPRAIAVDDLTVEPYASELRERGFPWKSFIGGRVYEGSELFGVIVFFSTRVRRGGFEQADRDFIDLMSTLIGAVLARERMQSELHEMAFHDTLTGLANRALLEEFLSRAVGQAERTRGLVAIHYLDLDRFKPVNDEFGHAAGDEVLVEASRRFTAAVRVQDVVARIGGDEFVVLQSAADDASIQHLDERLRHAMDDPVTLSTGASVAVGVSVGTAIYPRDARDASGLLRAADAAMYAAKTARKELA
jgi:diguanylate cyclase (GGDEF)-like protein/PAS domain S-box-containing protein